MHNVTGYEVRVRVHKNLYISKINREIGVRNRYLSIYNQEKS
jgi:hypothetical protein